MKDRQFVTPLLVRDGDATPLKRVPLDEHTFTEAQLQDLLFKYPQLIPVGEIEPIVPSTPILRWPSGDSSTYTVSPFASFVEASTGGPPPLADRGEVAACFTS